ncbi:hypothetical protein Q7P37_008645 [Cladosporium fusiforme]
MGYWSLAVLVISVSFLAYRHPEVTRNALPPWLRSRKGEILSAENDQHERVEDEVELEAEGDAPSFKVSEPEEAEQGDDETPKSNAIQPKEAVPSFSLNDNNDDDKKGPSPIQPPNPAPETTKPPPTLSPQPAMPPPPKPTSSSSLMPPPAPKPSSLKPSPSLQPSTLMPPPSRPTPLPNRAPPSNLLPNRGPPTNSQQRAGASAKSSKGKILLSPGHSPMDWAALSRSPTANLAGVPSLQRVTPSHLKTMTGRKGKPAWSSYHGKVYNLTPYLPFHPGGEPELMRAAGRDGGKLFMEVHPWVNWEGMLSSCVVGILVAESEAVSDLEEMD